MDSFIKPGVTTLMVADKADEIIRRNGAVSAFKGYRVPGLEPFPGIVCASVNSCIVHGIPREDLVLKEGDIIGIDVGVTKNGYFGDAAKTYQVGKISEAARKLMDVTKRALDIGINAAKVGSRVGDISHSIGAYVTEQGYFVADNLTGHGVGVHLHEDPMIPNSGIKNTGAKLKKGMTIAIEPMVNVGTNRVYEKGWEFFAADNSLSAHYEHTILITEDNPRILTG